MEEHDKVKAEPPVKAQPPVKAEPVVKADEPSAATDQRHGNFAGLLQPDEPLDAVVDRWFADNFYGSVVARDVDTYNHVYHAVEELKKRLRAWAGTGVN